MNQSLHPCLAIFSNRGTDVRFDIHHKPTQLLDGIATRCWWCVRIFSALQKQVSSVTHSNLTALYPDFRTIGMWRNAREVNICYVLNDHSESITVGSYLIKKTQGHVVELASNTYSQSSWDFVVTELQKCEINHKACVNYGRPWCPTRLLKLSMTEEGKLSMRLVSTDTISAAPRYITLSHMWGHNATLQLTSSNMVDMQRDIPASVLPKKYLDAAVVAWKLDVHHLWIDSLCIMQDSFTDWERESATMDRTYRYGYCNIAACSAQREVDGLFYSRDPLLFQAGMTEFDGMYFTYQEADLNLFKNLDQEPLYKRGWVCQERLLCRRNISFTRHQIFFECAMELTCEAGKMAASFKWDSDRGLRYLRNAVEPISIKNMRKYDCIPAWLNVVQAYSAMDLTRPEDKLIAISGLARRLHTKLHEPYLAGLWKSHLCIGLAWEVVNSTAAGQGADQPVRCTNYRAPSWSWASVNSRVTFPLNMFSSQVTQLCWFTEKIIPTNNWNEFGQIQYARLEALGYPFFLDLSWQGSRSGKATHKNVSNTDNVRGMEMGSTILLDEAKESQAISGRAYALPLLYDRQGNMTCLLLKAVVPSWGCYQRIGILKGSISRRAIKELTAALDYSGFYKHWKTLNAKPSKPLCRFLAYSIDGGKNIATLEPVENYRQRINLI